MSSFSFWRPVRITAIAVLAAAALFLALQTPTQPSAQAVNTCRMTDVTGTMTVYYYAGNKSSVIPIKYSAWLIPGQTSRKVFTQTAGPVRGSLTITITHPTVGTVAVNASTTVNSSITGMGSTRQTLVSPFPVGNSRTVTITASVQSELGGSHYDYARGSFTVYARGVCPT